MERVRLLEGLSLGSSVAEFDSELSRYFLRTHTFRSLVHDDIDIVAGDKGSGKTAIYRYLSDYAGSIDELKDVVVLPGFNPSGSPVFQRLAQRDPLSENQYISVWKAYIFSLIGNGRNRSPAPVQRVSMLLRAAIGYF